MNQAEEDSIYHSLEDQPIDVGCLLVEPRSDQVSVSGVWCYEENSMGKENKANDAPYNLGIPDSSISMGGVRRTKLNAHAVLPHEVGVENLLATSSVSPCDEYLLDMGYVDHGACIDYVSNEVLHVGSSCSQSHFPINGSFGIQSSLTGSISGSECQNYFLNKCNFGPSTNSSDTKVVDGFEDFSNSFIDQDDNDDTSLSQNGMEIIPLCQDEPISSAQDPGVDAVSHKRSRKPTKRYIDESSLLSLKNSKKKKESSSVSKVKVSGVRRPKPQKEMEPKEKMSTYEFSFDKAIQVPFISQGPTESPRKDLVPKKDSTPKKDSIVKKDSTPKKDSIAKKDSIPKKDLIPKKDSPPRASTLQIDSFVENYTSESEDDSEGMVRPVASGNQRKHHKLWSVSEVKKLIDGVAHFGVGKWTHIKKLLFASSAHRTAVDLKDKWRNLLKASQALKGDRIEIQDKRCQPWRPLPKAILCRVRELASVYPYPRESNLKISKSKYPLAHHVSSPARIKSNKVPVV